MSERYIERHFADIVAHANVIEQRKNDDCTIEAVRADNAHALAMCRKYDCSILWIDGECAVDLTL